jgi:hypothetical protein
MIEFPTYNGTLVMDDNGQVSFRKNHEPEIIDWEANGDIFVSPAR